MKLMSFNVNGLRSCMEKGFMDFLNTYNPDIIGIQETKMQQEQSTFNFDGYYEYWNCAEKKGYSGTLVLTKKKPLNVIYGINGLYNDEGRVITLEFDNYYFITVYTPNSKEGLTRLPYRMEYEDNLVKYMNSLNKPVILCGDLNVAHKEIDIKNPNSNHFNPGFSDEERDKFSVLLNNGYVDTWRYFNPNTIKYSWWSYRFNSRANNAGWRIDYFVVSNELMPKCISSDIHNEVFGSDHCPVSLEIDL